MITLSSFLLIFLAGVSLGGTLTWDLIEKREQRAIQQARAELMPLTR